jgi:protein-disulfide isomerase
VGTLELGKFSAPFAAALVLACGASGASSVARSDAARSADLAELHTPRTAESRGELQPSSSELPVDVDDGVWGAADAPVTLIVFTDLECPFCARAHASLIELERRYGAARLRVVIKHVPLAGHEGAVPAARVAQAVLALAGRGGFFRYLDRAFANQERVAAGEALALAGELGLDPRALLERADSAEIGAQVLRDVLLANKIAVAATPHFRINGLARTGVRPLAELAGLIDAELAQAGELRARGVAAIDVYALRVRHNFSLPEDASSTAEP